MSYADDLVGLLRGTRPTAHPVWTADLEYWLAGQEEAGTADPRDDQIPPMVTFPTVPGSLSCCCPHLTKDNPSGVCASATPRVPSTWSQYAITRILEEELE